jgi:hypothetical protein
MKIFFGANLSITKRLFGFLYADIRKAGRLAKELKIKFGYAFLNSCRKNPKPNPGNIVHLMRQDNHYANDDQRA